MGSDALILAIDQGTTNTKAILVDQRGTIVGQASRAMAIEYPQPGWVQQDAGAIWQAVRECIDECLASAGSPALAAIGISNQRETGVAWERASGAPDRPGGHLAVPSLGGPLRAPARRWAGAARSRPGPACPSTPCSRPASCAGCWTRRRTARRGPRPASSAWARWTAGCSGT